MPRRKKKNRTKAECQMNHAAKRAWERYGFDFHYDRQVRAVKQITDGEAEFIEKQSGRISIWWVTIDGVRMKVVYDKHRKTIASVLPEEFR